MMPSGTAIEPSDIDPPSRRLGDLLAGLAVGVGVAALLFGGLRVGSGAGLAAGIVPVVAALAGAVAAVAGLMPGLLLLPVSIALAQLGLLRIGAGDLAATVYVATLPAVAGALAARVLACRVARCAALDQSRLALVVAVAATAVPLALAAAATLDWPDRGLTALHAIVGLVLATFVGVLATAAGGDVPTPATRLLRLERFDWRMSVLLGIVGGYAIGHVPFGPAELVLVYLVMRGFPASPSATVALLAGLVPALAALPLVFLRHSIDFQLAFAIVPAAFSGSVATGWWMRGASPLIGAKVLALLAVAANLCIIILALR